MVQDQRFNLEEVKQACESLIIVPMLRVGKFLYTAPAVRDAGASLAAFQPRTWKR